MIPDERRLSLRKTPDHLAYLSLPCDNGGIVIDVSEGGLGFRAIAPVKADGPIHFRFSIDSAVRICAVGELAWKDETGKTGGLRFTQLPDEVREQISVWAGQSTARAKAGAKATAKASVLDIPVSEPAIEVEVAPSSKADLAPVVAAGNPLHYNLKPPIFSGPSYKFSMFSLELNSESGATAVAVPPSGAIRHPIAAVALTIILAFLVSVGIFAYLSTSRAGELVFDWGEKMWGGFYSQSIPQGTATPASSAPDFSKTLQK
jgi:hypothetical protein